MRTQKLSILVFVGLVLLLSACAPAAQPEQPRMLSVVGNARLTASPDIAYISIGVHTENASAAQAVADNNAQAQKIADTLAAAGVESKDIQTQGFNIYPQDEWGPEGERIGTRFIVDNMVQVTLRDLDGIGDVLASVVDAGANNVFGISFDIEDKTELIAEARKQAVENAKQQAEELAAAAGTELGPIQNISYYTSYPAPLMDNKVVMGLGGAQEAVGGVPITSGQIIISADVSVSYTLR
jgi:uncharacterized protein